MKSRAGGVRSLCYLSLLAITLTCCAHALQPSTVTRTSWGQTSAGTAVDLYTITSGLTEVKLTTYGARILSVRIPDKNGKSGNVIVGPETLDGYVGPRTTYMGATIGRYANRIARGQFVVDGKTYQVPTNSDGNALHGGPDGFNQKVWEARTISNGVEMTLVSPDGDMGFPGKLVVHVRFTLTEGSTRPSLKIGYMAQTDRATVLNLTNHAFFNLGEDSNDSVLNDVAMIQADLYTPNDSSSVPTGGIDPVEGTSFDFRKNRVIGAAIPEHGYDQNFVLRSHTMDEASAVVMDSRSGRSVRVYTTEPGLQFFVPRFGPPPPDPNGTPAGHVLAAFCLETQHFPDAPNHPEFASTVLRPGKEFRSTTIYVFDWQGTE